VVSGLAVQARGVTVDVGAARLLDDVDLHVPAGGWTCVLGRNGAGKSTLLHVLAGLRAAGGDVRIGDRALRSLRPRERALRLALAPQAAVVPPALTVLDYALLGRTPHRGPLGAPGRRDRDIARATLARLALDGLESRRVGTLSGGERQRAVLARALTQQPRLLLLDEPTAALDLGHAQEALELVDALRREDGLTVVSTLHDLTLAGQYADALVVLDAGRAVASGSPSAVLTAETVARHFGASAAVEPGPGGGVRVSPLRPGGGVVPGSAIHVLT
jgi:iron complex transport system ATP-binding protein